MGKKLCEFGEELNPKDKKLKYFCRKCELRSAKEKHCCKPEKLRKTA